MKTAAKEDIHGVNHATPVSVTLKSFGNNAQVTMTTSIAKPIKFKLPLQPLMINVVDQTESSMKMKLTTAMVTTTKMTIVNALLSLLIGTKNAMMENVNVAATTQLNAPQMKSNMQIEASDVLNSLSAAPKKQMSAMTM